MNTTKADVHTPEELLEGASSYLESDDPQLMRAAVLEAFTALETFVYTRVFDLLENKLDPLLIKWLRDKARVGLDDRLEVFAPIAVGKPVEKNSKLWTHYKQAQKIRNQVTHMGQKVTTKQAKQVVDTVYEWLSFLGSTVEVELNLLKLKEYLEANDSKHFSERQLLQEVNLFFNNVRGISTDSEVALPGGKRADLILDFGNEKILIELKEIHIGESLISRKQDYLEQVKQMLSNSEYTRAAIVVIFRGETPEIFKKKVLTYHEGSISVVGISVTGDEY